MKNILSAKECSCEDCPIAKVANLIGDKWTLLIIRDLLSGSKRFGDLETSLEGISTRTLAKKLKELEVEGFTKRKEYKSTPPKVEYSLTSKGKELHTISDAMKKYGAKYL